MTGKKLERIEEGGGFGGRGWSVCQRAPKHTTSVRSGKMWEKCGPA